MKILILPGASDGNRHWADAWTTALSDHGHEVKALYYDHWGKEEMFSFEKESAKLTLLDPSWRDGVTVVAKSIGSVLCVYATDKSILHPAHSVFMGFPTDIHGQKDANITMDIKSWLSGYHVPTRIFQNDNDPVTNYKHMKEFVAGNPSIETEPVPGDTHKYLPDTYLTRVLDSLK